MEEISLDEMIDVYDQYSEKFEDGFDEDIVESDMNDYDKLLNVISNVEDYYILDDIEDMKLYEFIDYVKKMVLG